MIGRGLDGRHRVVVVVVWSAGATTGVGSTVTVVVVWAWTAGAAPVIKQAAMVSGNNVAGVSFISRGFGFARAAGRMKGSFRSAHWRESGGWTVA